MSAREFTSEGRLLGAVLAGFFLVAVLAAADLIADLGEGTTAGHVATEGTVFLVGLVGFVAIARVLREQLKRGEKAHVERELLAQQLKKTQADAERWRTEAAEHLEGLGVVIDRQFERWSLSPAEKEVALLLLKGLSHKEIAGVRSITEATARQQAGAIYRKAGVAGRNDLAAFFLEDLLLPTPPQARQP